MQLDEFRQEARAWLAANCPASMRTPMPENEVFSGGRKEPVRNPDTLVWVERMAERGWTVPMWPKAYGGAGLDKDQFMVLLEEMRAIGARSPLTGMGVTMIGPTLLEFGTEEQKLRHLPKIASGEIRWCQGYSEPGSGSDLASLQTRAVDKGDHFVINGSKIWTTLAQYADWMFCLVRTDPDAPKHDGISMVLFPMDQAGVTVKPLKLINGNSQFCQCFFDDVVARKDDLLGELNKGWTVGKRLLQHERSNITTLAAGGRADAASERPLAEIAAAYLGRDGDGRLADHAVRRRIAAHRMDVRANGLTQRRFVEESQSGNTPGAETSLFKYVGANLRKARQELLLEAMGTRGLGWSGDAFSDEERSACRTWLGSKAGSIAGGTNEVQLNIIAKRVLGLPD